MRKTRTTKLKVLDLENRLTPAVSVNFTGGNLTITGDFTSNTILVQGQTGKVSVWAAPGYVAFPGNLALQVPANLKGTYAVTGNLTVNTSNSRDFVVITINDGASFNGNVNVSMGNSADDLIIRSDDLVNPVAVATIQGRTTINGGLGADNLSVIGMRLNSLVNVNGGGTGFREDKNGNPNKAPGDVFRLFATNVGSDVIVSNAISAQDDTFFDPLFPAQTRNVIQGSFIVSNQAISPLGGFILDGIEFPYFNAPNSPPPDACFPVGLSGLVYVGADSVVNANVIYTGSLSADATYILGTVNGSVTSVGNAGQNLFYLGLDSAGAPGNKIAPVAATVNGNATFIAKEGVDTVRIFDGTLVAGSVNLNLGDGNNCYDLNRTFTVNGGFCLHAGNGDDAVNNFGGSINGNIDVSLGNGENTIEFLGAYAGARIDYSGGGGVDRVTVTGQYNAAFRALLYGGDDFFTYNAAAALGSAYIDGGTGFNTYTQFVPVITWPQTLLNF